jgi:hypothetical protein
MIDRLHPGVHHVRASQHIVVHIEHARLADQLGVGAYFGAGAAVGG